jgi:hypothetical protein
VREDGPPTRGPIGAWVDGSRISGSGLVDPAR